MLIRSHGEPLSGRLFYRDSEQSFDVEPHPTQGVASLLVNDIQIEIDEDGYLLYVWGLCPRKSWKTTSLIAPVAEPGRLLYAGSSVIAGVSRRLNEQARWAVLHDPISQLFCIGDPVTNNEGIIFAPGATAVLSSNELVALWLDPSNE